MNKKFFTLLVALCAMISFGASAQSTFQKVTIGAAGASFSASKSYLLEVPTDNDPRYLSVDADGRLLAKEPRNIENNYANLQRALWNVKATTVEGNAVYVFTNVFNGMVLSFDSEKALAAIGDAVRGTDNLMGGDIEKWNGSTGSVAPAANVFFAYTNNKNKPNEVVALTYGTVNNIFPVIYADKAAAEAGATKITPKLVTKGALALTANDVNTLFGSKGVYMPNANGNGGKITATKDSYFQLNITPKNTIANPFTGELQAQGVTLAANDTTLQADPFASTSGEWLALKTKDSKYIVVDTSFINGTLQATNGLIQTTKDDFWTQDETKKTNKRLAASYLFRFLYNASNNAIVIQSKSYIAAPVNLGSTQKPNIQWGKEYAENYVNFDDAAVAPNTSNYSYFTYAALGEEVAYTFGQPLDMLVKLVTATASYQPVRVPSGVYILQVTGSADAKNIGKYAKYSLGGGILEYVDVDAERQNLQHLPAAQWVITSTANNSATIVNREFATEFGKGTTYKTGKDNEFFFLTGDTLKYVAVTADNKKDAKLGYLFVDEDAYNLDMYTFRYLHDLSMDNPVAVAENGKLFVNNEDKPTNFRLVEVGTAPYGFNGGLTGVAQLERTVYQIAAFETINFDDKIQYVTYDPANKKYFLMDEEDFEDSELVPSQFLLKENYEIAGEESSDCYYAFLEAIVAPYEIFLGEEVEADGYMFLDSKGKPTGSLYTALVPGFDVSNMAMVKYNKTDKKYEVVGEFDVFDVPYASSKVSVDNSNLALVNGILDDSSFEEVAVSAFKVGPDDSIIYRTIGAEEGEDALEQNIRIYRINATAKEYLYEDANSVYSVGPNAESADRKDINDQINFLGVEGKGDDKLAEAVMTARYVRGTVMPQYLLMMDYNATDATSASCPVCDKLPEPIEGCPHHDSKEGFATARILVNFADSVSGAHQNKNNFKWNTNTRLGFVNAKFSPGVTGVKDSLLTILSSNLKAEKNVFPVKFTAAETKKEGKHNNVFFSFRLIDEESNDFMLESFSDRIGGSTGGWVRIHNGVPVLCKETKFADAIRSEAEIFNFETTDDNATSNEGITAGKVKVEAGNGTVTIKGAAGQFVAIANILGQTVYTGTLDSDEATIAAPAGVVIVTVAGETAKALVK